MATPRRVLVPRGLYHVFTSATGGLMLFREDDDHEHFNWTLGVTVERYGWQLLMWLHLDTHVHLLVETPEPNLDDGMQRTKSCYALYYNRTYRRRGALFDGRYGYRVIESELQFFRTVAYIAQNPVAAGLCEQAREWGWSSVARYLRGARAWPANATPELVRRCGGLGALEKLIERAVDLDDLPTSEAVSTSLTASEAVKEALRSA